ncbi:hypothetical protein [Pseudomonas corrugata]|uniref:hypothetical protein n=1 Tax=Pseudomonas corrugata TaxID=47879 RepID=UPI002234C1F9|nr:hypothetical protein [Pseudomonas corrugata]UZE08259.1 hypothetical protein LOY65_10180 [Pseudomonas corrugata]
MKPNCTALVSQPMSVDVAFQARISSSAVLLALNHSEVPNSWATAIVATGPIERMSRPRKPEGVATTE